MMGREIVLGHRVADRRWLVVLLVLTLVALQMAFVQERVNASHGPVTGSQTEPGNLANQFFFNSFDSDEVQHVWNDATGGTFTLTFDIETTSPLPWNATDEQVELALEALEQLADADVAVTGSGNAGDEWVVTFAHAVPELTATDSLTDGVTSIATVTQGQVGPIDPSGLTFVGANLMISDSEIEEEETIYDGINMWTVDTTPALSGALSNTLEFSVEPNGLAFNPADNGHLYISDDGADRVYDVHLGDSVFDAGDSYTFIDSSLVGVGDPEDVAWDPVSGQLFIASGVGMGGEPLTVAAVSPGPNDTLGTFGLDGALDVDDALGTQFDVTAELGDLEGLGYRAASDTLLLVDPTGSPERILEYTKNGRLVRTIQIGATQVPSDVAVGISGTTLYLVDRGNDNESTDDVLAPAPRDGRWYEYSSDFHNLAPFVDAGSDQTIEFGETAALTGDSYDDGQGSIYGDPPFTPSVTWSEVSGPGTVNFGDANSLNTTATFSQTGVYVLQLSSTDGDATTVDTLQVTVNAEPPANIAPTVSAGPDRIVTLPDSANLSGSANDDGLPDPPGSLTTTWSKVSGPGTVTFGNKAAANTTASFSTSGTYVLRLTADDGDLQSSDTVTVTVNPGSGTPPPPPPPPPPPSGSGDTFIDDDGNTFEADIEWLAGEGITRGCNPPVNDRFCPDDFVTRGQMSAFLVRAFGYTDDGGGDLFIDDDGSTFEADIDRLGTAGVTRGCNPPVNDRFCPDDFVTRGQMAAFLVRAFDYTDDGGGDLFVDDDGSTFEADIDRLGTAGVTRGCNPPVNDRYCPDDFVTRGQMAAFLHRAFGDSAP